MFASMLLLCLIGKPMLATPLPPVRPPSLLLIVVDTLRFDGGDVPSTDVDSGIPSSLRGGGRHFVNALAASTWTSPSIMALMSGYYPSESGIVSDVPGNIRGKGSTLAERLSMAHFRTSAVVSNPAVTIVGGLNVERGFDRFDSRMTHSTVGRGMRFRNATETTDAALNEIRTLSRKPDPWFLWVHYFEPHGPYQSPRGYLRLPGDPGAPLPVSDVNDPGKGLIPRYQFDPSCRGRNDYVARYRASSRYVLDEVDRLLARAQKLGSLKDTIVVFTSDHGEFLGERDYWFQHGVRIDPALVHIPLVIRRGSADPLCFDARPVCHEDMLATLLPLLNGESAEETRGENLFSDWISRTKDLIVEYLAVPRIMDLAVYLDGALVVRSKSESTKEFRLDGARWSSVTPSPSRVGKATEVLRPHVGRVLKTPIEERKIPPEEIQRLRALGYLNGG